jgi:hypothetical protein
MDLFFDEQYIKDCENKLNYYALLYVPPQVISGYTILNNNTGTIYKTDGVAVVFNANVDDVHIIKVDGTYCREYKISQNAKKFIL